MGLDDETDEEEPSESVGKVGEIVYILDASKLREIFSAKQPVIYEVIESLKPEEVLIASYEISGIKEYRQIRSKPEWKRFISLYGYNATYHGCRDLHLFVSNIDNLQETMENN